jgi:predicted AAA+ superfamily ATPase
MEDDERSALIPKPVAFRFNTATDSPHAVQLLTFLAMHLAAAEGGGILDFVHRERLAGDAPHAFMLGDGTHRIRYRGEAFRVTVRPLPDQGAKEVVVQGIKRFSLMQELLSASSQHTAQAHHYFDAQGGRLVRIRGLPPRTLDSLFLREGDRAALLEAVEGYLDGQGAPPRLNLLLCGPPGSGKTTTIRALATHFQLHLAVIPPSRRLDNDALLVALIKARAAGCRLVALEDVDALLDSGALTAPGLRQCMDGLLLQEGLILVLTARRLPSDALRADLALHLSFADEFQTRSAFEHYLLGREGHDAWVRFWKVASRFRYSMAGLQHFLLCALRQRSMPLERFQELARAVPAN